MTTRLTTINRNFNMQKLRFLCAILSRYFFLGIFFLGCLSLAGRCNRIPKRYNFVPFCFATPFSKVDNPGAELVACLLKASNPRFVRGMDSTNFETSLCARGHAKMLARGPYLSTMRARTRKNLSIVALRATADEVPLFDGRVVFSLLPSSFFSLFSFFIRQSARSTAGERVSKNSRLLPRSLFSSAWRKKRKGRRTQRNGRGGTGACTAAGEINRR